ncbi:S1 family peptidase, partial [Candidatus Dojkabacteria bacterium]|nr:S1 family peptidase [Candidatus Dojkabacteria bacterium]
MKYRALRTFEEPNHYKTTRFLLAFSALFIIPIVALSFTLRQSDIAPTDSEAVYGGQIENNAHPYAGYMLTQTTDNKANICGTVYLSSNFALTAAHCLTNATNVYLGYSLFNFDLDQNFLAQDIFPDPEWDGQQSNNDIAMVRLPEGFYAVQEYAEIASPQPGCNYEVLGYGNTEEGSTSSKLQRLRKTADLCLTALDDATLEFVGEDGGICFGDSGSPIFEKGTNKVVGVISAIVAGENTNNPCYVGNTAIAARLDTNSDFDFFTNTTFAQSTFATCGQSCESTPCLDGLFCDNTTSTCVGPDGNPECISVQGAFCSALGNVRCSNNLVCSFNTCTNQEDLQFAQETLAQIINTSADGTITTRFNTNTLALWALVLIDVLLWVLVIKISMNKKFHQNGST